jgi:hypothetical protein
MNQKLSPRQYRTVLALLEATSLQDACRRSGTPERTLRRWLREEVFLQALAETRQVCTQQFASRLMLLRNRLLDTALALIDDASTPPATKMRGILGLIGQPNWDALQAADLKANVAQLLAEREQCSRNGNGVIWPWPNMPQAAVEDLDGDGTGDHDHDVP